MTPEQINHLVNRFLSWKLPANFNPDGGISATRPNYAPELCARTMRPNYAPEVKWEPSGTNLLDATQAKAMVLHMLEGMPVSPAWQPMESAPKAFTYGDFDLSEALPNGPVKRIRMSDPVVLLTPNTLRPDEKPEDQDYHLTKASWVAHDDKELWWDLDGEMPFELEPIGWMPIPCHDTPKTGEVG